jgi:glyoxylate reductase
MAKPTIFITRKIAESAINKLEAQADVEIWQEDTPPPYELLLQKAATVDGILTMLTDRIDANLIEHAGPNLKVISQLAVGFDNIDVKAATAKGIPVSNTPGVLTETTADFTWALMMAAARRVAEGDREVHAGLWRAWGPDVLTGYDLYGATLGIIGFGRIGKAVARRAAGFNMRVLYNDPECEPESNIEAECVGLDELLKQSDYVSLHTYLSKDTYHLIGREQLQKMKPTAVLVNTARGPVVDQEALAWALSEGIIAAAALDVTEPEPIPNDSPLLKLNNLVITPHIASASKATRQLMAEMTVENLLAGISGKKLPNCANPDVYRA